MRGVFDADSVLEITIGRACAAVAHCLSAAESAEHVRLAHVHMLTGLGLVQGREPGDPADALNA
jgi:hypothetical protein